MPDPMTLEETIRFLEHQDPRPGSIQVSALHWLTTLKAQVDERVQFVTAKDQETAALIDSLERNLSDLNTELAGETADRHSAEDDRDRLAEHVRKLREALDTAVNYNFSNTFRQRAIALLKETEPGDGG